MKPWILDLCCGAGLVSRGLQLVGFRTHGVDLYPQPNYIGDEFTQADALEFLRTADMRRYVAIHMSAPCQLWTGMASCRPGLNEKYPDLITPGRPLLEATGLPWVMENVPRSPLRPDLMLCGQMFGLPLYRHRIFESNMLLMQPEHPKHLIPASKAGHWKPGTIISVSGHCSPIALAREAMGGVDWCTRDELAEGIPLPYTRFIGEQLMAHLTEVAA